MELRQKQGFPWAYCVSGLLTGLVNGFFGAGGGMILIPLLTRLCRMEDKAAFASSLSIILPITVTSLTVYLFRGGVEWTGAAPYLIGGLAGGLMGGALFRKVSAGLLHKALGILILWGGLRLVIR